MTAPMSPHSSLCGLAGVPTAHRYVHILHGGITHLRGLTHQGQRPGDQSKRSGWSPSLCSVLTSWPPKTSLPPPHHKGPLLSFLWQTQCLWDPDLGLGEDGHLLVPLAEGTMGWGHVVGGGAEGRVLGVQAQHGP